MVTDADDRQTAQWTVERRHQYVDHDFRHFLVQLLYETSHNCRGLSFGKVDKSKKRKETDGFATKNEERRCGRNKDTSLIAIEQSQCFGSAGSRPTQGVMSGVQPQ